jgi:hypothetical protein
MPSFADLPELGGFFSYSRDDDDSYKGRLSALRQAIQDELGAQLGRSRKNFRLWQDKEAIPPGRLWEAEITTAVSQSVFFIPIVTPRVMKSKYCRFEFDSFLMRERQLGRADLVFPILYVPVPELEDETHWRGDAVLSVIARRQYVDWQDFRHSGAPDTTMRADIARFCGTISKALRLPWLMPDERQKIEETEAQWRAEQEKLEREAEAKRRADAADRRKAEDIETLRRAQAAEEAQREAEAAERHHAERERASDQGVSDPSEHAGSNEGAIGALRLWWKSRGSVGN